MGFGPLLCRSVKVKTARGAIGRITLGPNAAFGALYFHAAKVGHVEKNAGNFPF
jgi:hypothetical protein